MKLYVQLRPDNKGMEQVHLIQQTLCLEERGSLIKASAIHMTVLHIGVIDRLLGSMKSFTTTDYSEILQQIYNLAAELEETAMAVANRRFTLTPAGYEYFGVHGSTYVLTFQPTPELTVLHRRSLLILKTFIVSCGVINVDAFMAADSNLQYALSLRPHLAVAKGRIAHNARTVLQPMSFKLMPVVYDT